MATASFIASTFGFSGSVFGNLFDLARLRAGASHAEVCEVCNTINMGSARSCKCCGHELPASYAGANPPLLAAHFSGFVDRCHDFHRFLVAHFTSAVLAASNSPNAAQAAPLPPKSQEIQGMQEERRGLESPPVRARGDAEAAEMIRLGILTVLLLAAFDFWYWNRPAARDEPPVRMASSPEGRASLPEPAPSLTSSSSAPVAQEARPPDPLAKGKRAPEGSPPASTPPLEQQTSPPERSAPATDTTASPPKSAKAEARATPSPPTLQPRAQHESRSVSAPARSTRGASRSKAPSIQNASSEVPRGPPPCPSDDEICLLLERLRQTSSDGSIGTAAAPASSGADFAGSAAGGGGAGSAAGGVGPGAAAAAAAVAVAMAVAVSAIAAGAGAAASAGGGGAGGGGAGGGAEGGAGGLRWWRRSRALRSLAPS